MSSSPHTRTLLASVSPPLDWPHNTLMQCGCQLGTKPTLSPSQLSHSASLCVGTGNEGVLKGAPIKYSKTKYSKYSSTHLSSALGNYYSSYSE